jgi:response regulator of citrate/malate metabolism
MLTLSSECLFFKEVEKYLKPIMSIEISNFSDSLDIIDCYLKNYAQLIVLDIDLIKENVLKLIEVIHSIHRDTQIILLLSKENTNLCPEAFSRGVISYHIKPLSPENFSKIIKSTLTTSYKHN